VIETDEAAYPCRLKRVANPTADESVTGASNRPHESGTDISYPTGIFDTTLCGHELTDALNHNRIREWKEIAVYDCEANLRQYAELIYVMRRSCEYSRTHGLASLAKGLLVGICGKFGQRNREWLDCEQQSSLEPYAEWYAVDANNNCVRFRSIGWRVQREIVKGFSPDACPAIAGWITSLGRMALLKFIRIAGWENVYYVDTDSIVTNNDGFGRLHRSGSVADRVLGSLSIKSKPQSITILGPKHYIEDGQITNAGEQKATTQDSNGNPCYWKYSTPLESIRSEERPTYWRQLCNATLISEQVKQR
jgi:hypothetical protein